MVLAADAAAQAAGLRVGMPETKARVLVSSLLIEDADPLADAKALDRLTGWMLQHLAPIAAADPPDGLVIDTTVSRTRRDDRSCQRASRLRRHAAL